MAYLDDTAYLTDDERQRMMGGSAPAAGPAGISGASVAGSTQPAPSSGFVNLARYFDVNKDTAKAQGEALGNKLESDATSAVFSDDPSRALDVAGQLDAAANPNTRASVVRPEGDTGYTQGMGQLDAYLSGRGAGAGRFENLRNLFSGALGRVESPVTAPDLGPMPTPSIEQLTYIARLPDQARRLAYESLTGATGQLAEERARQMQDYYDYIERRNRNLAPFMESNRGG